MKGSKLSEKTGLILLGLLAFVFRYPITETPTGSDNFYYIQVYYFEIGLKLSTFIVF